MRDQKDDSRKEGKSSIVKLLDLLIIVILVVVVGYVAYNSGAQRSRLESRDREVERSRVYNETKDQVKRIEIYRLEEKEEINKLEDELKLKREERAELDKIKDGLIRKIENSEKQYEMYQTEEGDKVKEEIGTMIDEEIHKLTEEVPVFMDEMVSMDEAKEIGELIFEDFINKLIHKKDTNLANSYIEDKISNRFTEKVLYIRDKVTEDLEGFSKESNGRLGERSIEIAAGFEELNEASFKTISSEEYRVDTIVLAKELEIYTMNKSLITTGLVIEGFMLKSTVRGFKSVVSYIMMKLGKRGGVSLALAGADGALPVLDILGAGLTLYTVKEAYDIYVERKEELEEKMQSDLERFRSEMKMEVSKKIDQTNLRFEESNIDMSIEAIMAVEVE